MAYSGFRRIDDEEEKKQSSKSAKSVVTTSYAGFKRIEEEQEDIEESEGNFKTGVTEEVGDKSDTQIEEVKPKKNFFQKAGDFIKDITLGKRKEGDKRNDWERFQEEFIGFESKGGKANREEVQQYYDNLKTGKEKVDTLQEIQDLAKVKAYEVLRDRVDQLSEELGTVDQVIGKDYERVKGTDEYIALKKLETELGMTYVSKGILPEAFRNIDIGFAKGNAFNESGDTIATPVIKTSTLKKGAEVTKKLEKEGWDALTQEEQGLAMIDLVVKIEQGKEVEKSFMDKVLSLQGTSLGWGSAMAGSAMLAGGGTPDPASVSTGLFKVLEVAGVQAVRAMNLAPLYTSEINKKYLDLTTPEYAYFVDKTGDIILEKLQDARYSEQEGGFGVVSKENKAMQMAKLSNYLEVYSESWGEVLGTGGEEFLNSLIKTKVFNGFANWMRKTGKLTQGTLSGLLKSAKFDGVIGEFMEEELLNPLQSVIERTEYQGVDTKEGRERMLIELLGFGATQTGAMIQGYMQNKDKQKAIDAINGNKERFGLSEDKALDNEGNLYDMPTGEIIVPKEEVIKEPESVFGGIEIDQEEEMLKADIAQAQEKASVAEEVKEVEIMAEEKENDYSQDAKVQEVLRDIGAVLDIGAKKKNVTSKGQDGDYQITVDGIVIPEFIPENLRSRKYVQKAYDAFSSNTVPQEGTKAWQVYQAILEESKGREGLEAQEAKPVGEVRFDSLPNETQVDISANILESIGETNLTSEQLKAELEQQISLNLNIKEVNSQDLYKSANILQEQVSRKQVEKLKELIQSGEKLDPILVDGEKFIDGIHRLVAYKELGLAIPVVDISNLSNQLKESGIVNNNGDEINFTKSQPTTQKEQVKEEPIPRGLEGLAEEAKGMSKEAFIKEFSYLFEDLGEDSYYKGTVEQFYETAQKFVKPEVEVAKRDYDAITEDDLPFRQDELKVLEDRMKDQMTIGAMKEISKVWFGDDNVELVKNILRNKKALGVYLNRLIEIKSGQAHMGSTLYHEAVHKAFDIFLTEDEKSAMMEQVVKRVGKGNLRKAYNELRADEKFRIMSYQNEANRIYAESLNAVQKYGVGVEEVASRLEWKDKKDLLTDYANSFGIKPENLWGSTVQVVDKNTNEKRLYLVDGEIDATHAQALIDGKDIGIAGEDRKGLIYHITAMKPTDFENPYFVIDGVFDPSTLPYSEDISKRSAQREYRLQFGIAKTGNLKYRGTQVSDVNAMAEEWLAENIIDYVNNRNSTTFWGKLKRMVDVFVDRMFRGIDHIKDIEDFYESLLSGRLLERQEKLEAKQQKNWNKFISSIQGSGSKTDAMYRTEVAKEVKKLTTKILKKLEGKTGTVKKQFISDLAKQQDIKQVEKDIINDVLKKFPDDIEIDSFEQKVLAELLPLERVVLWSEQYEDYKPLVTRNLGGFEYANVIYESPVGTKAGDVHFATSMGDYFEAEDADKKKMNKDDDAIGGYFGHIRTETNTDNSLRRVIELQSDLYQKGNLEEETYDNKIKELQESRDYQFKTFEGQKDNNGEFNFNKAGETLKIKDNIKRLDKMIEEAKKDVGRKRLSQYKDPTAHLRMAREEIRQANLDGIKTLQFPTGKTAVVIEGLGGGHTSWYVPVEEDAPYGEMPELLTERNLKVGTIIQDQSELNSQDPFSYIVVELKGEGRFNVVPYRSLEIESVQEIYKYAWDKGYIDKEGGEWDLQKALNDKYILKLLSKENHLTEEFNISEDFVPDKTNPIFKFYEDTLGKYLKNQYDAKEIKNEWNETWFEIDIKPEYAGAVEAFRTDELVDYGKVAENTQADLTDAVSVKLPELITMATELGANIKLQKNFRKGGKFGDFTAGEDTDSRIRILRTLFEPQGEEIMTEDGEVEKLPETPEQQMERIHGIEKVLAHEIGHLFDWFGGTENMTLKRGNILGRIANLRNYTEGQFMDLENKDVKKELKTLTQVWNPFDEASVPKKYKSYRYSAKELYAEAISVFLNKPSLVKEVAPNFYEGLVEYMARKKEVSTEYFAIRDMIKQGSEIQSRVDNMKEAQEIARGKRMTIEQEKEAFKKQSRWQEAITGIKMGFVNQYAPYLDKMRKAWKDKKITLSKVEEAEQLMGDLALKGNDAVKYAQDVQEEFFVPVSEAGIDIDTVGQILVLERNLGDRRDLANPQGLVYDYAKETYDYVKGQLNPAQWTLLQEKLSWWRDYNFELVKKGYEAGVYSEQFFEEIATVNKNTYTPFAVVDYIEDNYVTAGVIQAVGTTKGVENPLTTQMLKSLSLMQLTARNGAKQDVVGSLAEIFPDEVVKAEAIKDADGRTIGFKKNPELERKGYTQLELLEDGKRSAYYMDRYIVSMFESSLNGVGWDIARFVTAPLRMVNRIFKPAVTVMKASFQFYSNPLKDYQRSLTNLTALSGLFDKSNVASRTGKVFGAFTKEWIKNLKRSWNYAGGEIDAITQKMLDMYVLSSNVKYEDIDIGNEKFNFDPVKNRIVYKGGVNWLETLRDWGSTVPVIKNTLVPVYDFYMRAGSTLEVNSKIAGFQYLSKQVGEEKASFYTRRYVGTPDYMQKGKFTPLTNELVVFSNVGIQAITADMDLATRPNTASGYWVSTMFKIVFPKLLMLLGASLLRVPIPDPDDPEKKKWVNPYDYLSEYYKSMYMAFPIGYDEQSESFIFVKAPSDEVGAVIGNLVWKMATYLQGEGMKVEQLGSAIAGLIPFTTGDNPLLSIGRDWIQYAQGRNPYDDFRGRLAINTAKWNEGGMTRFVEMLKWSSNEMGLTNFSTYDSSSDTTLQKTMDLPLLERMFEVTNYGLQEREEWEKAVGKQERNKVLDKYIESYFAQPSDKKLLELQEKYVIAVKGERPEGGWSGTEKAEETRLKTEFKREILENSGNAVYRSIAKSGLNNNDKLDIINKQRKRMSDEEFTDFMTQAVRYEVVKGEMFAEYIDKYNLSGAMVLSVVKESIPVLSMESNNTLLSELRKRYMISNQQLLELRRMGLLTGAGYSKYIAITKK